MAQGVAYAARLRGVPATIVVPDHAPQTKIDAIERYGGRVDQGAVRRVVEGARDRALRARRGPVRPPGADDRVMAGQRNDRPRAARAVARLRHGRRAYGGGGLVTGIASAVKARGRTCVSSSPSPRPVRRVDGDARCRGEPASVDYSRRSSTGRAAGSDPERLGARRRGCRRRVRAPARRGGGRRAHDRRARARDRGGRGRDARRRRAVVGLAGARKIVCIVSGGNIDPPSSAVSSSGSSHERRRRPDAPLFDDDAGLPGDGAAVVPADRARRTATATR